MDVNTIKEFQEKEKYSITVKEWNFIKKSIKSYLGEEFSYDFEKRGSDLWIEITVPWSMVDIKRIVLDGVEDHRYPCTRFTDEMKEKIGNVRKLIDRHQVCYSERDSMTDYAGLYRFHHTVQLRSPRDLMDKLDYIIQELRNINKEKSNSGFFHEDFNRLATEVGVPTI